MLIGLCGNHLVSSTKVADGTEENSVWETGGKLQTKTTSAGTGSHASTSNFSTATENHMYFKLDNVIYQVSNATVNGATVDAGIEEIATSTWSRLWYYYERTYWNSSQ